MATPHSAMPSPVQQQGYPQNGDLYPLDFLSFALETSPQQPFSAEGIDHPEAGPSTSAPTASASTSSYVAHPSDLGSQHSRRSSMNDDELRRGGSNHGKPRGSGRVSGLSNPPLNGHANGGGSVDGRDAGMELEMAMDVDGLQTQALHSQGGYPLDARQHHQRMDGVDGMMGGMYGMGQGYDSMLQQQLEGIHMQSPLVFEGVNPQSPFHPLAQMFLTSPPMQPGQVGTQDPSAHIPGQGQNANAQAQDSGAAGKWRISGTSGMPTPATSTEMFPQMRPEAMTPLQLEMLAKQGLEGVDFNLLPLLSPALSQQNPSSYSPVTSATFPSQGGAPSQHVPRSPLETLQEQQRLFQEQLMLLQHQQRQIQATAAAVAASTSPFLAGTNGSSGSGPSSGPSRPATTPGVQHHGGGSAGPSPGYFSPLTSPALEASNRPQYHHYSPGFGPQQRAPHPLSALSSPALNPIGSSGGAQQTLSPALEPQNNADMADPEYIRALIGMLDDSTQQQTFSPTMPQHGSAGLSPLVNASVGSGSGSSAGTGPHRNALPAKSRPSPMLRPTHRGRQPSSGGTHAHTFSLPNSPLVAPKFSAGQTMTHLPPAAIDQRGVQQHLHQTGPTSTTSSTPSPVDLSHIMPPPPIPSLTPKGMTPMTPASLMNLGSSKPASGSGSGSGAGIGTGGGSGGARGGADSSRAASSTNKGDSRKAAIAPAPASKRVGNKAVPPGKQRIAMRPPGTVGVRAATKAAAAAAAAALNPPEGENRKTSHKAAEQKRRDSLKAGFDELRLLLPPINTEALDPESGEPIPGSSAPRLLPKSSLVPDDNPNRGVSKVALLKFSNEYIVRLHDKVDRRDEYIEKLRLEVARLRNGGIEDEITGDGGEDLLEMDMTIGEEDDLEGDGEEMDEEDEEDLEGAGGEGAGEGDEDMEEEDSKASVRQGKGQNPMMTSNGNGNGSRRKSVGKSPHLGPTRPGVSRSTSSQATVTAARGKRGE